MNVRSLALVAALAVVSVGTPRPAAARKMPWSRIKGSKDLMKNELELAAKLMKKLRCYYGCKGTITACLRKRRPASNNAWRLARYVVFLVGKGLSEKEVAKVISLRRRSAKPKRTQSIALSAAPSKGSSRAPVKIVEYADFRCGHCAKVSPLLKKLAAKYKGKVAVYFKPYPLRPGAAVRAAQAALAAQLQGKFWKMHDLLFDYRSMHDSAGLVKLAKKAGLDVSKFKAAMTSRALLKRIDRIKREGLRVGVKGTPTLFFNGKRYRLRKDMMHLSERIEEELEILGKKK